MLYSVQGLLDLSKETKNVEFKEDIIRQALSYAKDIKNNLNFISFREANETLLKMMGMSEYDEYRDEIVSELLTDLTKFGTTSDNENNVLNKIVHEMNYNFSAKNEVKQQVKKQVKQVFK